MKIVHVANWYVPDMGYEENLLPAQQKKLGHEVCIVTSDRVPAYPGYRHLVGRLPANRVIGSGVFEDKNVAIYRLPCRFEVKNGAQVVLKGLRRTLKELKPDIVHVHGALTTLALLTVWYSKKLGYKVFVDDHMNKGNFKPDTIFKRLYVRFAKLFYRIYGKRVCFWLPVTYAAECMLKSIFDIPEDRMEIVHLGADANRFAKSDEARTAGRARIGVADGDTMLITSGKFDASKEIDVLIKAFCKIASARHDIYLLLLGSGSGTYMRQIRALADESKYGDKILFGGFVLNKELPLYYNAADLGIWPGDPSITVIEAVATGLPVVLPDQELGYEVLFRHDAAVGFRRGDPDSLAEAIQGLLDDPTLKSKIAVNCSSLIATTLSWTSIAKRSVAIYSKNCNSHVV